MEKYNFEGIFNIFTINLKQIKKNMLSVIPLISLKHFQFQIF